MLAISARLSRASSKSSGPPARGSVGTPELFVYGTLMLDDVVRTLMDRVPASEQTSAPGWRVARLPDRPYPGLVDDPTHTASGRIYADLTEREWAVLDAFEDPSYDVAVVDLRNGRRGLAYVWPTEARPETWTLDSLDDAAYRTYLDRCAAWRSRYEDHRSGRFRTSVGE